MKEKGRKVKEKGRKGKENEKNGSKMVNNCKIEKNLGRKATMGVQKQHVARGGKNIIFRGGGINIVLEPKYRPLTPVLFENKLLLNQCCAS